MSGRMHGSARTFALHEREWEEEEAAWERYGLPYT